MPLLPIEVLHITDCHLFADPDETLLGLNTLESFTAVLTAAARPRTGPEFILATGDLSQDGSPESYKQLTRAFRRFGEQYSSDIPVYWLPGNHDLPAVMDATLTEPPMRPVKSFIHGVWQIVMLDSSIPEEVGGKLSEAELKRLDECLSKYPEHFALVCLHHNPVAVGAKWMEGIGLENSDELFAVLDRHPQARAVLWGHVHQEVESVRNGIRLMASPSTCIQFQPDAEDFGLDDKAPGFRRIRLFPDGQLETKVYRTTDFRWEIDRSATGY